MAGNRWRGSRHDARILRGRARAKPKYSTTTLASVNHKASTFRFCEIAARHLAETELTSMVSSFKTPVTVAVLPACWSSVARAALSVVCRM